MNDIREEYFNWLYDLVCHDRYDGRVTYRKLLEYLHNTEFTYDIPRDSNRAGDGVGVRYRFAYRRGLDVDAIDYIYFHERPCSVLEMMIGLAMRCEENFMCDPQKGDRTSQWFWLMINNLGLGDMMDDIYDEEKVERHITRFLKREYASNGRGGLFVVNGRDRDMRDVEIWYQLCWYLDNIT